MEIPQPLDLCSLRTQAGATGGLSPGPSRSHRGPHKEPPGASGRAPAGATRGPSRSHQGPHQEPPGASGRAPAGATRGLSRRHQGPQAGPQQEPPGASAGGTRGLRPGPSRSHQGPQQEAPGASGRAPAGGTRGLRPGPSRRHQGPQAGPQQEPPGASGRAPAGGTRAPAERHQGPSREATDRFLQGEAPLDGQQEGAPSKLLLPLQTPPPPQLTKTLDLLLQRGHAHRKYWQQIWRGGAHTGSPHPDRKSKPRQVMG